MTAELLTDFHQRGLLHQVTETGLAEALSKGRVTGYIGFDPTADSHHVGGFLQIVNLMRMQRAGHRPIALMGGGTGLIGDPSFKAVERSLLDQDTLGKNLDGLSAQLRRFLDFDGPDGAIMVNNADWLCTVPFVEFLRDVGKHFSVNQMIQRDAVRLRLESREQGISFTEFSYILLQAYDFLELFDRYDCTLQIGGSDQWGNIVSGCDLVRRKRGATVHGLTVPLVTKADGSKFGKSEQGNVWLDPARTSPYEFYQFWLNSPDTDVVKYLNFYTFLSRGEIDELARGVDEHPERREAQLALAAEITRMVHGPASLQRAEHATRALFGDGDWRELSAQALTEAFANTPTLRIPRSRLGTDDAALPVLLAEAELFPSRGKARKAVETGGVYLNDRRMTDSAHLLGPEDLLADTLAVLRRGKKTYHVIRVDDA